MSREQPLPELPASVLLAGDLERAALSEGLTSSVRYALATAVARPGSPAAVLDAQNRVTHRLSIEDAVQQAVCFFVEVDEQVMAVDFDEDAVGRSHRLCAVLSTAGYRPV